MSGHVDEVQLSGFSPFDALKTENLGNFLEHIDRRQASSGETLFKIGDTDKRAIYLLSGSIKLTGGDGESLVIAAGTDDSKSPIAPGQPRQQSAVALDEVQYFSIDSDVLDVALTLDQTGVYEVGDFSSGVNVSEGDWMTALLQTRIFQQLPPHCLQMIFMRLQRVDFKAGDIVIQQGSDSDFFYVIRSGRCLVTRETGADKDNIDLAELAVGGTFGEEAMISEAKRNATVRMLTDGILMRLGRDDFDSLLKEPMLVSLDPGEATEAAAHGGQWLDVRVPSEYNANGKEGAINIPLYLLRHKLNALERDTPYIVYCDTGRRSAAAAFILNQSGFQSAVLKDGMNGVSSPT